MLNKISLTRKIKCKENFQHTLLGLVEIARIHKPLISIISSRYLSSTQPLSAKNELSYKNGSRAHLPSCWQPNGSLLQEGAANIEEKKGLEGSYPAEVTVVSESATSKINKRPFFLNRLKIKIEKAELKESKLKKALLRK